MEPTPSKPTVPGEAKREDPTTQASPYEDAEKIRLKRLAKLQKNDSNNAVGQQKNDSNGAVAVGQQKNDSNGAVVQQIIVTQSVSPPTELNNTIKQFDDSQQNKDNGKLTVKKPATSPKPQTFEDWQNEVISKALQITLEKSAAEKSANQLIYLNTLVAELKEEDTANTLGSFKIGQSLLDRALVARLSIDPNDMSDDDETLVAIASLPQVPLFDYLLDCWKRASKIRKDLLSRGKSLDPSIVSQRVAVMDKVKELVVSYAGLILQMPDMFPQINTSQNLGPQQLIPRLLAETDTHEGLPFDFIRELAIRFEQDGFEEVFGPALIGLANNMLSQTILKDFLSPLRALTTLTGIKPFAAMLPTLQNWNPPNSPARVLEVVSLLGPFCRISVFPDDDEPSISDTYFSNPHQRTQNDVDSAITSIRATIQNVQRSLFEIFNNIVRSSPDARESVLSYWATIIRINERRAQMQVDPALVGTDGFLFNFVTILLRFADPFMDAKYTKIDRIDVDYFRKSLRIHISQETKINATQQESDEYYRNTPKDGAILEKAPNFISEIFFTAIAMHHYGLLHTFGNYTNFLRDLIELQKQYDRLKDDQHRWVSSSSAGMFEAMMERCKRDLDKMTSKKLAYDSVLLDPNMLSHSLQFYNLVMNWILRVVDPNAKYPWEPIRLPLDPTPPNSFRMLPEYIIEDITEFFLFISRYNPMVIISNSRDELVNFVITFLQSSSYIKNPYLKAKLVEILYYFTMPFRGEPEGGLGALLNAHPLSLEHLMPALMSFYVEVEQTGAHSQFYDKFNIRYNISQIFKCIWHNPVHRQRLKEESRKTGSFVRFANLLMNDATFLLDECLTKLTEIHDIQNEMDNTEEWNRRTQESRQDRENHLRSLERQATSYMTLGDETVKMLESMTLEAAEPFLMPEIVDRLAAMLDYNLVLLVGEKCTKLKVKNPEKYHFDPRGLLSQILDVFLHLCHHKKFVQAVARDERSYKKELFPRIAVIVQKYSIKSEADMNKLLKFATRVDGTIELNAEMEEELGEVPERFLDPLMYDIMEDPVILPESKAVVDRSTIKTHLLSDPTDPFNRRPLKIEDVIPDKKLREEIEKYKRKNNKFNSRPSKIEDVIPEDETAEFNSRPSEIEDAIPDSEPEDEKITNEH